MDFNEKDRQTDEHPEFVCVCVCAKCKGERDKEKVKVKMNGDNKLFENWNLQNST